MADNKIYPWHCYSCGQTINKPSDHQIGCFEAERERDESLAALGEMREAAQAFFDRFTPELNYAHMVEGCTCSICQFERLLSKPSPGSATLERLRELEETIQAISESIEVLASGDQAKGCKPYTRDEIVGYINNRVAEHEAYMDVLTKYQEKLTSYEAAAATLGDEPAFPKIHEFEALREYAAQHRDWGRSAAMKLALAEAEISRLKTDAQFDADRIHALQGIIDKALATDSKEAAIKPGVAEEALNNAINLWLHDCKNPGHLDSDFSEMIAAGMLECPICLKGMLTEKDAEIGRLREEVKALRQFGNKDCTAMADAALARSEDAAGGES